MLEKEFSFGKQDISTTSKAKKKALLKENMSICEDDEKRLQANSQSAAMA